MPKKVVEMSAVQVRRLGYGTVKRAGGIKRVGEPCPVLHAVGGVSGLHLYCRPPGEGQQRGARSWILRTMVGGRRIDLGLGGFPDVTLAQAREEAREIKHQIRYEGYDPVAAKRAAKSALIADQVKQRTFEDVALQFYEKKCREFSGKNPEKQARRLKQRLEDFCFPILGNILMRDLETRHVLQVLEPIWTDKNHTAERVRGVIEKVCEVVRNDGVLKNGLNPARWGNNLDHFLPDPHAIHTGEHRAAVGFTRLPRFWELLQIRDTVPARALEFQILTAARPGEVRFAEWSEIDIKQRLWTVPGWKIKGRKDHSQHHKVPLTERAIEILKSLPQDGVYVFPGYRGKEHISENALNLTVKEIHETDVKGGGVGFLDSDYGKVATAHGMRSAFKDFATEVGKVEDYVSELALSHLETASARAAYKRGDLMPKRRRLMNSFERYLYTGNKSGKR